MPAPSPELEPDPTPSDVGIFAGSDDMATEIGEIADGDVLGLEELRELDPDQVEGARAGKRLGWLFWLRRRVFGLVVALGAAGADPAPRRPDQDRWPGPGSRPAPAHWFGTDTLGRDILSRVIWGGRVSLVVGIASILMGLLIGGTVGIVAGYFRGRLGDLLMGAMDVLLSFPALLLALAIVTLRATTGASRPSCWPSASWPSPRSPGWSGPTPSCTPNGSSSPRHAAWAPATGGSSSGRCCPT